MGSLSAKGVLGWDGESCQPISNGWETHPSTGNVPVPVRWGSAQAEGTATFLFVCLTFYRLKASALLKFPLGQSAAALCGNGFCSSVVRQEGHNCGSKPNFSTKRQIVMGHSFDLLKHFFPQKPIEEFLFLYSSISI